MSSSIEDEIQELIAKADGGSFVALARLKLLQEQYPDLFKSSLSDGDTSVQRGFRPDT